MTEHNPELRREWDADASLRDEFNHNYEAYECYRQAADTGRVKVLARPGRRKMLRGAEPDSPAFASTILQQWKNDPELREEFAGDLDAFVAFTENEHNIRILGA